MTSAIQATPVSYFDRLALRCEDWRAHHPTEYDALVSECEAKLAVGAGEFRTRGQTIILEAVVRERIRVMAGWPSEHEYKTGAAHQAYR